MMTRPWASNSATLTAAYSSPSNDATHMSSTRTENPPTE